MLIVLPCRGWQSTGYALRSSPNPNVRRGIDCNQLHVEYSYTARVQYPRAAFDNRRVDPHDCHTQTSDSTTTPASFENAGGDRAAVHGEVQILSRHRILQAQSCEHTNRALSLVLVWLLCVKYGHNINNPRPDLGLSKLCPYLRSWRWFSDLPRGAFCSPQEEHERKQKRNKRKRVLDANRGLQCS